MKIDAVKYSIRGLIKATHIALSKGRENEDSIDELASKVDDIENECDSLRSDVPDLVSDEVSNCLSDQLSDELSSYGIGCDDWKEDLKSEVLDLVADDDKDFNGQLDAHGNLITDLEDKVEKIEVNLADKIPYLEGTLETVAGSLDEMESAYCELPSTVEAMVRDQYNFEEELSLHEHRLGSLERKLGVHPDEFKKDDPKMDELVNAVQKLYELNGIELNFDLGDK